MRAYDQLCFQWSVHVLRESGAEPEHYEFLATDASDPRREFVTSLCGALGERGSIVVYNAHRRNWEIGCLLSLEQLWGQNLQVGPVKFHS
jgi:hypothetical protein